MLGVTRKQTSQFLFGVDVVRTSFANSEELARANLAVQVHARTVPVVVKVATLDGIEGEVGMEKRGALAVRIPSARVDEPLRDA